MLPFKLIWIPWYENEFFIDGVSVTKWVVNPVTRGFDGFYILFPAYESEDKRWSSPFKPFAFKESKTPNEFLNSSNEVNNEIVKKLLEKKNKFSPDDWEKDEEIVIRDYVTIEPI